MALIGDIPTSRVTILMHQPLLHGMFEGDSNSKDVLSSVHETMYPPFTPGYPRLLFYGAREFDQDDIWIFVASFGACFIGMHSIWPMVRLWWPGWVATPSAYHTKFVALLIFVTLTFITL